MKKLCLEEISKITKEEYIGYLEKQLGQSLSESEASRLYNLGIAHMSMLATFDEGAVTQSDLHESFKKKYLELKSLTDFEEESRILN